MNEIHSNEFHFTTTPIEGVGGKIPLTPTSALDLMKDVLLQFKKLPVETLVELGEVIFLQIPIKSKADSDFFKDCISKIDILLGQNGLTFGRQIKIEYIKNIILQKIQSYEQEEYKKEYKKGLMQFIFQKNVLEQPDTVNKKITELINTRGKQWTQKVNEQLDNLILLTQGLNIVEKPWKILESALKFKSRELIQFLCAAGPNSPAMKALQSHRFFLDVFKEIADKRQLEVVIDLIAELADFEIIAIALDSVLMSEILDKKENMKIKIDIINILVNELVKCSNKDKKYNANGCTMNFLAEAAKKKFLDIEARQGNIDIINILLKANNILFEPYPINLSIGEALVQAAKAGNLDVINILLDADRNNARISEAYLEAAKAGHVEIVKLLHNRVGENEHSELVELLEDVSKKGYVEVANFIIEKLSEV